LYESADNAAYLADDLVRGRAVFRHDEAHAADNLIPSYDVQPGGQKFVLNNVTANTEAPITVVQNWLDGLRGERR